MLDETKIDRYLEVLRVGYQDRGLVKGWEPPDIESAPITWGVREGYLRVVNGRCGFEIITNSFVVWTDAGRRVMEILKKP